MPYEWDPAKSASNKLKHGISFEEAVLAIEKNGFLALFDSKTYPGQNAVVFLDAVGVLYVGIIEQRGNQSRIITVHRDRKLEKKYGQS